MNGVPIYMTGYLSVSINKPAQNTPVSATYGVVYTVPWFLVARLGYDIHNGRQQWREQSRSSPYM